MRSEPLLGSSSFQNWKGMLHAIINRLKFQFGVRDGKISASGQFQGIKNGGLMGSDNTSAIYHNIVLQQNNLQTISLAHRSHSIMNNI